MTSDAFALFVYVLASSRFSRMCRPRWNALRTCSPGPMREGTVPVLRLVPRQASCTQMLCCLGHCSSQSAAPPSSKTSCAGQTYYQGLLSFVTATQLQCTHALLNICCCCRYADTCPNCPVCWIVMMSTCVLQQGRLLPFSLSWLEMWTL